jgi:hypothetical protein
MQENDDRKLHRSRAILHGQDRKRRSPQRHRDHRETRNRNLKIILCKIIRLQDLACSRCHCISRPTPVVFLCDLCVSVVKCIYMLAPPRSPAPLWISSKSPKDRVQRTRTAASVRPAAKESKGHALQRPCAPPQRTESKGHALQRPCAPPRRMLCPLDGDF